MFVPTSRRTCLLFLLLASAEAANAQIGRTAAKLDPKFYSSPSGTFRLHVDPSTMYGQGEGDHRLLKGEQELWAKKLPFTLWDAAVTDDGTVAGYAYSLGYENTSRGRGRDETGRLHLVILAPDGGLRMNEVLPRRGSFSCTSTVERSVTGIIVDPDNDRFIVRCSEGGWSSRGEAWRVFRLSTGRITDEFQFDHPRKSEREHWSFLSVRPVAGTPLILVNWEYNKWDDSGNDIQATGGAFNLIDASAKPVWELDRPGDYPDYYEYTKRLDEKKDRAEIERLRMLEHHIRQHGAVLRTDQPRRFDLWFVREQQRVTFEVEKGGAEGWRVREIARAPHDAAVANDEASPDKLESLALKHLGTVELMLRTAERPEIRDIEYFDIDDRGRIGFLRAEEAGEAPTFVLVDGDGGILHKVSLRAAFGENFNLPKSVWLSGERWLILAQTWTKRADGEDGESLTRAWWLDLSNEKLTPIEPFTGQGARRVCSTRDGGFVVTIDPPLGSNQPEVVVAFDREGKERWRALPAPQEGALIATSGVTATTDGRFVVERGYGRSLTFLDARGAFIKQVNCEQLLGSESSDADSVSADANGGLIIVTRYASKRVYRLRGDGGVASSFVVKHPDGRLVDLVGFPDQIGVRVTKDGVLWACDGHTLLRLNPEGVVERVLGESPDSAELRRVAGVFIDQSGNTYVSEERNGVTHVFDPRGEPVRVLRPNPDDFAGSAGGSIQVAADGSVFVDGLKFAPTGERVGFRKLPGERDEPWFYSWVHYHPGSPRYWVIEGLSAAKLNLVGPDDQVVRTIERRPDGGWLDHISAAAVGPDGSLAVVAGPIGLPVNWNRPEISISIYSATGEPRQCIKPPNLGENGLFFERLAFNGRYVLSGPWDYDQPRYVLLDTAAAPPKWYDLGPLAPYRDVWHCFFVKGGKELWMFAENARKIERFALPDGPGEPAAAARDGG